MKKMTEEYKNKKKASLNKMKGEAKTKSKKKKNAPKRNLEVLAKGECLKGLSMTKSLSVKTSRFSKLIKSFRS